MTEIYTMKPLPNFVVNIVPADGVMPLSAETSEVVTMNGSHA